ncbi:MAG: hypothetical protein ABGZ23_15020, partial [Fuerstiella sp.]
LPSIRVSRIKKQRLVPNAAIYNPRIGSRGPLTLAPSFAATHSHRRLTDPEIKADASAFGHIAQWLRAEFLNDGRLCAAKPLCHATIERKARRLWERTESKDAAENWRRAEEYVRDFYENLLPAIVESDQLAVASVLSAAAPCPETGASCELVDSLEVAIVTYFFDPKLMNEFFEGHATYL